MSEKPKNANKIAGEGIEKGSEAVGAGVGATGGAVVGAGIGAITALATGGTAAPLIKEGAKSGADIGGGIGKDVGKAVGKVGKEGANIASKTPKLLSDPVNTILEKIVKLIIDFLIPIPLVGEYLGDAIMKYKAQILFFSLGTIFVIYSFLTGGVSAQKQYDTQISQLPAVLEGYVEEGFTPTDRPNKSPLGGECLSNTVITAYFHDPGYYKRFGKWHTALDMIPSNHYYSSNKAFSLTGEIVMFATIQGKTEFGVDGNGALIVKIFSDDGKIEVGYAHLKTSYVKTGDYVNAGDPIGIMGSTGKSTGVHVHYWIAFINEKCLSCLPESVDPYPYLFGNC